MTATSNVLQQPTTIDPGQRWTFVDSSGKRTEYVVGDPTDETFMADEVRRNLWARWEPEELPESLVYLLNEQTGKYATVTRYWLRGSARPGPGVSHWLPPESVA